jgi:hypothetical protein
LITIEVIVPDQCISDPANVRIIGGSGLLPLMEDSPVPQGPSSPSATEPSFTGAAANALKMGVPVLLATLDRQVDQLLALDVRSNGGLSAEELGRHLVQAAQQNRVDLCQRLVDAGADVNFVDDGPHCTVRVFLCGIPNLCSITRFEPECGLRIRL